MKKFPLALLLVALSLLAPQAAPAFAEEQAKKTVTLVADEWCPYNCDPASDHPGILVEIAKRALEKEGIEVKYEILPWTRAIGEARRGTRDAIIGAAISDAPDFIFPEVPQFKMKNAFFTLKDSTWNFESLGSLDSVSIGVIRNYTYSIELDAYIEEHGHNLDRVQVTSGENALEINVKKLAAGRITAVLEDESVLKMFLRDNPAYQGKFRMAGHIEDPHNGIHIAFSPAKENSKHYADLIARETRRLHETGEINALISYYLGNDKAGP